MVHILVSELITLWTLSNKLVIPLSLWCYLISFAFSAILWAWKEKKKKIILLYELHRHNVSTMGHIFKNSFQYFLVPYSLNFGFCRSSLANMSLGRSRIWTWATAKQCICIALPHEAPCVNSLHCRSLHAREIRVTRKLPEKVYSTYCVILSTSQPYPLL